MSQLFPRKNPCHTGSFDDGKLKNDVGYCMSCYHKHCVGTVSFQYCPKRGFFRDLWATSVSSYNTYRNHPEVLKTFDIEELK